MDLSGEDRGVAFLPWAHVFGGCVELNLALATGSATGICGDATKLGEYLGVVKPTILFAVPRVWNKIYAGVQTLMQTKPAAIQWIFRTALEAKTKLRKGEQPSSWRDGGAHARREDHLPEDPRKVRRAAALCRVGRGGAPARGRRVHRLRSASRSTRATA